MSYCKCTVAGGGDLQCHADGPGNTGSAPQNWIWYTVHSNNCCAGGSQGGGVHPMCQGHSCAYLETTTCTGSYTPPLGDGGEQEALWGYDVNLTFDDGIVGSTNTYILTEESPKNLKEKLTTDYTPSGEEWIGPTHIMPGGTLMSGTHMINSEVVQMVKVKY